MLTAAPKGVCAMLQEECCFWVNQTGQVQTQIRIFLDKAKHLQEQAKQGWDFWPNIWSWKSWLFPCLGPITSVILLLLFGLCVFNLSLIHI